MRIGTLQVLVLVTWCMKSSFAFTEDMFLKALDSVYEKGHLFGVDVAKQYEDPTVPVDEAITKFQRYLCLQQAGVAAVTGAIPYIGIPASMAQSIMTQIALAAGTAQLRGYDMTDPESSRAYVGMFLIGDISTEIMKQAGTQFATHSTKYGLSNLSGKFIIEINKMVGRRLFTKYGTTGVINLVNVIPIVSGFVNAGIDAALCYSVANEIEKHTFRGANAEQRALSDLLDEMGMVNAKEILIREQGFTLEKLCSIDLPVLKKYGLSPANLRFIMDEIISTRHCGIT